MRTRKEATVPEQALYDLARAAGKTGQHFGGWCNSDAAQELILTVDRLDSDAVRAAFTEGYREYQAANWKVVWTTAPEAYDGGSTEPVGGVGGYFCGKVLRRVVIDPHDYAWQTDRYVSGFHGAWDEDPRIEEAKIRETIDRERKQREEGAARREAGLLWLSTAPPAEIEDSDDNWEAWQARGLRTDDARAERKRRHEAADIAAKAAEWDRCSALIPEGCALIDEGTKGYAGTWGWVSGQPGNAWTKVRIVPGWPANDPELANVVGEGNTAVGSLTFVAGWITEGRAHVATPEEAAMIPPPGVFKRIGHREWKSIRRVNVDGRAVWIGRATFGADYLVLDDAGHIVRSKKVREAALARLREAALARLP